MAASLWSPYAPQNARLDSCSMATCSRSSIMGRSRDARSFYQQRVTLHQQGHQPIPRVSLACRAARLPLPLPPAPDGLGEPDNAALSPEALRAALTTASKAFAATLPRGVPEWSRGKATAQSPRNLTLMQYMHAAPPCSADPSADEWAPLPKAPPSRQVWATGKRKTATARVYLVMQGTGRILVNGVPYWVYFTHPLDRGQLLAALSSTDRLGQCDAFVRVDGGGHSAQAQAACHGMAKALKEAEPDLAEVMRPLMLLRRDDRVVERKKYGRKKARKRFQWVKR